MSLSNVLRRFPSQCRCLASKLERVNNVTVMSHRLLSDKVLDPPDMSPPIPEYVDRGNKEPLEEKRARLLYQSRKRGMTENGLLLSTFAALHLDGLNNEQLTMYDSLINKPTNDWEIYYWITENKPTPPEYDNEVMNMLKEHTKNENRDVRLQQPDLKFSE
ncbi:Succinate dehydrogenase assembly factor 2 [Mactra antiquata]